METRRDFPKRKFAALVVMTLVLSLLLAACSPSPDQEDLSQASTLPDLSGLAWLDGDRFLAVHDAKNPEENDLPRVSVLRLPTGLDGILWEPMEVGFPGEKSDDLESVARIPGSLQVLLVESTEKQDEKPFARRLFLATPRLAAVDIDDVIEWPVETDNVEGTAVAKVGDQLVFLYAERAEGEGASEIHFAKLQLEPLSLDSAGAFSSPWPTGEKARPVTAIDVDSAGVIYVASAEDPGDDNGPFRSAVYAIGEAVEEGGKATVVLYDQPQQIAALDGVKVEGLAVRELPGQPPELFVGFDDENYGGTMRSLRLKLPTTADTLPGLPNPASQYCAEEGYELEMRQEAGGTVGYCLFPDGSECEEWAFYRGECGPGEAAGAADKITARMLVEPAALAGPGPSHFEWSPRGASLTYVAPQDGGDVLWLYEATTGDKRVLLDPTGHADNIDVASAQWSPLGDALLLTGEKALWLLDTDTGGLQSLAEGGTKSAVAFAPSGDMVSYVQDNDLYTVRIRDGQTQRLTTDGSDTVFNGTLDWVYTEEFATRVAQPAYAWSPDGKWLLYLRLDDEGVQQHPVTDFRPVPPTVSYTRYPTAGSPNPEASLHLVDITAGGQTSSIPLPQDAEYILPFFTWTPDSSEALYLIENRGHTVLDLKAWNPATGAGRTVIRETDPHWINEYLYVAPEFLGDAGKAQDGGQFLWLSERDGFMHLYLYSREGELIRQLTEGEWLIDSLPWDVLKPGRPVQLLTPGRPVHTDPSGEWAYFSTTQVSPLERQLYRLNIEGGQLERLTQEPGFHFAALSGDGQYLVEQFSNVDTPPVTTILKADGSRVEVLGKCAGPSLDLPKVSRAFLTVKAHDGEDLYAQIVKPEGLDPARKYPVVVHWYGGPSLQLVSNRYGTTNVFNHIERDVMYTQEDLIVWRLDNRGSFGRGHAFETPIAGHLGPAALDDQLAGIEYLQSLPYVDADRIGSDGKSFGGFLTMYALIHAPDVLRAGVDGSGPTDWRYYDTVYTERYMGTPHKNPAGYEKTELNSKVDQLQIRPLIIHGLADTNVHLQNSVNLIEAMQHIDKPLDFVPLPNSDHHYGGDGLVAVLAESTRYFVQHLGQP